MKNHEIEEGTQFMPQFNADGLIACITTSVRTGKVLMFAYMNEESIQRSLETGEAHYWSRSRQELWHKGATSGNMQTIKKMMVDCDQDCLLIEVEMPGEEDISCHTGREGCFYREVNKDGSLRFISGAKA